MTPVYTKYFEFFPVEEQDLLDETYRIRHRVYCEERHFLEAADYPDGREIDEYDPHSVHLLGRHRLRGTPASTARLILPCELGFPMGHRCSFEPGYEFVAQPMAPESERYVEISRLAVSKLYRQRAGDNPNYGGPARSLHTDDEEPPESGEVRNPEDCGSEIFAGIYKCIYQESKRLGVTHWLVAMERSLYVMLRRMGHIYVQIGPTVDYYGPVTPYVACIADIEKALAARHPAALHYWMDGLEEHLCPSSRTPVGAGTRGGRALSWGVRCRLGGAPGGLCLRPAQVGSQVGSRSVAGCGKT